MSGGYGEFGNSIISVAGEKYSSLGLLFFRQMKDYTYHKTTITVQKRHKKYLNEQDGFNLSGLVRDTLDAQMRQDGYDIK